MFTLKMTLAISATMFGAFLLISGGSFLRSTGDLLFPSNDQSASSISNSVNTGVQSTDVLDAELVENAIRSNSAVAAAVGDNQFTVTEHRYAYVEGELWGVSAIIQFEQPTTLNGPWITVNKDALIKSAGSRHDIETFAELGAAITNELTHEEVDEVLGDLDITASDYITHSSAYETETEQVLITVDIDSGKILKMVPFAPPPSLLSSPVPVHSSQP